MNDTRPLSLDVASSGPTPNIDALSGRGVVFEHAYCQDPVCNSSCASVATGLRPPTTGVFNNGQDWRRRIPKGWKTALPQA